MKLRLITINMISMLALVSVSNTHSMQWIKNQSNKVWEKIPKVAVPNVRVPEMAKNAWAYVPSKDTLVGHANEAAVTLANRAKEYMPSTDAIVNQANKAKTFVKKHPVATAAVAVAVPVAVYGIHKLTAKKVVPSLDVNKLMEEAYQAVEKQEQAQKNHNLINQDIRENNINRAIDRMKTANNALQSTISDAQNKSHQNALEQAQFQADRKIEEEANQIIENQEETSEQIAAAIDQLQAKIAINNLNLAGHQASQRVNAACNSLQSCSAQISARIQESQENSNREKRKQELQKRKEEINRRRAELEKQKAERQAQQDLPMAVSVQNTGDATFDSIFHVVDQHHSLNNKLDIVQEIKQAENAYGDTSLHTAVRAQDIAKIKEILDPVKYYNDRNILIQQTKNAQGQSAMRLAFALRLPRIMVLLSEYLTQKK